MLRATAAPAIVEVSNPEKLLVDEDDDDHAA